MLIISLQEKIELNNSKSKLSETKDEKLFTQNTELEHRIKYLEHSQTSKLELKYFMVLSVQELSPKSFFVNARLGPKHVFEWNDISDMLGRFEIRVIRQKEQLTL